MTSSWYRGRRCFLLATSATNAGSLLVPYEVLDEVHVLFDNFPRHSRTLETTQERSPGGIDIVRCKSFL